MLEIKNLHAKVGNSEILRGIDLKVDVGEVHAIMGPNGSGKSTLAQVLSGRDVYTVTEGEVLYQGQDLLALSPEDRARAGVFLAFQYPVEIPGVYPASGSWRSRAAARASARSGNGWSPCAPSPRAPRTCRCAGRRHSPGRSAAG